MLQATSRENPYCRLLNGALSHSLTQGSHSLQRHRGRRTTAPPHPHPRRPPASLSHSLHAGQALPATDRRQGLPTIRMVLSTNQVQEAGHGWESLVLLPREPQLPAEHSREAGIAQQDLMEDTCLSRHNGRAQGPAPLSSPASC